MKAPQFRVRPAAERDLETIVDHLMIEASDEVARDFVDAALRAFILLASHPEMGRRWEGETRGQLANIRVWVLRLHGGYLIFYQPLADAPGIEVVHVFHGARDIEGLLEPEG